MRYLLLSGSHGRFEDGGHVIYRAGDRIDLTAAEAESLGGRVEPMDAGPPSPAEAPPAGSDDVGGGAVAAWPEKLPARAVSALEDAGIAPQDVESMSDDELRGIGGVGPASVLVLRGDG